MASSQVKTIPFVPTKNTHIGFNTSSIHAIRASTSSTNISAEFLKLLFQTKTATNDEHLKYVKSTYLSFQPQKMATYVQLSSTYWILEIYFFSVSADKEMKFGSVIKNMKTHALA